MENAMKLNERAIKSIRLLLPILVGVMLAVCAVLFILSAVSINKIGASPYTYETVGAAFSRIAVPVYITVALAAIAGVTLTLLLPDEKRRVKPPRDVLSRLKRAYRTADLSGAGEKTMEKIRFERRLRASIRLANFFIFAIGLVIALCCAINPDNYGEGVSSHELNASVINVVTAVVIYLSPALAVSALRIPIDSLSAEYELKLVEALPRKRIERAEREGCGIPYTAIAQITVISLAVLLIVLGIFNGGMSDVVQKAIKICTECIGLG